MPLITLKDPDHLLQMSRARTIPRLVTDPILTDPILTEVTLPRVQMPKRDGFVADPRLDVPAQRA
jgi:hypothetical protein